MAKSTAPIPITIVTGFLGSGKTTLILNLIPQLPPASEYTLCLLKNEFGDLAVDSQLSSSSSISAVTELLNGCICCNLVGQLSDSLVELRDKYDPDRIIIETSGSAFPATLAMEVNRLSKNLADDKGDKGRAFTLDGVVLVVDVENWKGYEDTSYTAKLQARYTDLVVLNKWECEDGADELLAERRVDEAVDRVRDLSDETPCVRSSHGKVPVDIIFGIDGGLAQTMHQTETERLDHQHGSAGGSGSDGHHGEVEVLSVTLDECEGVKLEALKRLLKSAPKDEVYRIKGIFYCDEPPDSEEESTAGSPYMGRYIVNWAFGRYGFTPVSRIFKQRKEEGKEAALRLTVVLATGEAARWKKKIEGGAYIVEDGEGKGRLEVKRIS